MVLTVADAFGDDALKRPIWFTLRSHTSTARSC